MQARTVPPVNSHLPSQRMARKTPRTVVGLEIEPSHIAAAEATVNGRVRVERAAVAPLAPGLVRDGEVTDVEALSASLKHFFTENKLPKRVRLGVANQRIVVRTIELPPLDPGTDLDAAVRFQAQENIPMPLDQAVLDYQTLGRVESDQGERLRVVLVAARRDMIDRLLAAARGAGLRPEGIDLSAFAMIRALGPGPAELAAGQAIGGTLYVNVGGMTNLAIASGSACHFTRVAAVGIASMAGELAERRGLTLEHSSQWLTHVGLATPMDAVEGDPDIVSDARAILVAGIDRVVDEVRNSLDFYSLPGRRRDRRARRRHRAGDLDPRLGRPGRVQRHHPGRVRCGRRGSARRAARHRPRRRHRRRGPLRRRGVRVRAVNLIPNDQRRGSGRASRSGSAVYAVLGVLGAVVLAMAVYVLTGNQVNTRKADVDRANAQAAVLEQQAAALKPYAQFSSLSQSRKQTVAALADSRFDWERTMRDLSLALPSDVWLTSLVGTVKPGVTFDGGGSASNTGSLRSAVQNPAIEMVGCTTSQSDVSRVMARLRTMRGVQRVSLASSEKAETAGGATTGSGGNSGDCRNGNRRFPQFQLVVFFDAPKDFTTPATSATTGQPVSQAPTGGTQ